MTNSLYPFADGDRLADRNTYFYTKYGGRAFLKAWQTARNRHQYATGTSPPAPRSTSAPSKKQKVIETEHLLEYLMAAVTVENKLDDEAKFWLAKILNKFEVTKRIHRAYSNEFRAIDKEDHRNYSLYLRAAEVFQGAYERSFELPYLNALLKVNDTLCAASHYLNDEQKGRLAKLIFAEYQLVQELAKKRKVNL